MLAIGMATLAACSRPEHAGGSLKDPVAGVESPPKQSAPRRASAIQRPEPAAAASPPPAPLQRHVTPKIQPAPKSDVPHLPATRSTPGIITPAAPLPPATDSQSAPARSPDGPAPLRPPPPTPPADPLPTIPAPPPPRPDPIPAPPNRANLTPQFKSGGGIIGIKPGQPADVADPMPSHVGLPSSMPTLGLSPHRPSTPATDFGAIERVDEARRLIARGEVLEARALLEAALEVTPATALHELGRTFDPYYIGLLPKINGGSEARRAAELYTEAIVHGSLTAGYDLDRLRALSPNLR